MSDAMELPASHMAERYEAPIRSWRDAIAKLRALQDELRGMPDVDEQRLTYILDHGFEGLIDEFAYERDREAERMREWEREGCPVNDERYDQWRKESAEAAI